MEDPWKHRSTKMKCKTCMWYVEKSELILKGSMAAVDCNNPLAHETIVIGRCRRHAPTMTGYPVVYETDWCGDHKLDETKV
jgi:hypothetical protein